MTYKKKTPTELDHGVGCPANRIETTHHEGNLITIHCLDCAAHIAKKADGTVMPAPLTTGPFAGVDEHKLTATMEATA